MSKLFACSGAPALAVTSLAMLPLRKLPEDNACPGSPELATSSLAAISSRIVFLTRALFRAAAQNDHSMPLIPSQMAMLQGVVSPLPLRARYPSTPFASAAARMSSSSSEERTVTEDTDGDFSTTIACDALASATRVGTVADAVASARGASTMAGAAADRGVLVSSVPRGALPEAEVGCKIHSKLLAQTFRPSRREACSLHGKRFHLLRGSASAATVGRLITCRAPLSRPAYVHTADKL